MCGHLGDVLDDGKAPGVCGEAVSLAIDDIGFDAKGADTQRLGAMLTLPRGTKKETYAAVVPVTISYG